MKLRYDNEGVRVYHGDASAGLAWNPEFAGQVDLIVTSPPYDDIRDYGGHGFDFEPVARACVDALVDGGVMVWVVGDATREGSETGTSFRQALAFMDMGLRLHDTMIYHKKHPGNPSANRYHNTFEYMFVFSKGKPKTTNLIKDVKTVTGGHKRHREGVGRTTEGNRENGRAGTFIRNHIAKRSNIWTYAVGLRHQAPDYKQAHEHPAIMPLALAKDHIRTWTAPGDLVLDPMAGSGTTLRAAVDLGRRAVGIEIHEPYVDLIVERMRQGVLV